MSLLGWCQWLEHTSLATAVSESVWLFPLIEGSHILALPLSVGMILMFDFRLLGLAFETGPAARMMADVVRWSKYGFAIMFVTGGISLGNGTGGDVLVGSQPMPQPRRRTS